MKKHSCIEKERKALMKKSPIVKGVRFDLSTIKTFGKSGTPEGDVKTGQTIWLYINKNGKEKQIKTFITHKYCPFCGKKYQ